MPMVATATNVKFFVAYKSVQFNFMSAQHTSIISFQGHVLSN